MFGWGSFLGVVATTLIRRYHKSKINEIPTRKNLVVDSANISVSDYARGHYTCCVDSK